eukprot:CAMPEP_0180018746 /NCGR_PEP_ID=MMETSP0984-20121128/20663_1 /TAXON_ID=483367 /ORGANISM="non described non described, Strain CCMP 2436" /LENGTH=337 /DNA_ID=CAMNT_0021942085 /DNA_START=95 /DNA_END=1105 /DNA_ORIENTATION=+
MGVACSTQPAENQSPFTALDEAGAEDEGPPEWLSVGLANAFDDPPPPSPVEESEASAGALRPPSGWRHSVPDSYYPVQWTRPIACSCVDWVEQRSALCWCVAPPLADALRACAPAGTSGPFHCDVTVPRWEDVLLSRLSPASRCPPELDGWWWLDGGGGDLRVGGELLTFHDADWQGATRCVKSRLAGLARPHTLLGLLGTASALLSGVREEWVFDEGYSRGYVQPGSRWLFRVSPHEFRVVEYTEAATNKIWAMYRLRRILRRRPSAGGESTPHPPALAEFVARARAQRPHEPSLLCHRLCGWAGAPTLCGCAAPERLDNAVVAVNPCVVYMWRDP